MSLDTSTDIWRRNFSHQEPTVVQDGHRKGSFTDRPSSRLPNLSLSTYDNTATAQTGNLTERFTHGAEFESGYSSDNRTGNTYFGRGGHGIFGQPLVS